MAPGDHFIKGSKFFEELLSPLLVKASEEVLLEKFLKKC